MKMSIIVTTYNRPRALYLLLKALNVQQSIGFEVIIADDGSGVSTTKFIAEFRRHLDYPLEHVWHKDEGFRASTIRNRAVARASGDYLIFLDGDCIPLPSFVAKHRQFSGKNRFVSGNRILLNQTFTQVVESSGLNIMFWTVQEWAKAKARGFCNRWLPLTSLPLGLLRHASAKRWEGVKACNLGLWKEDFLRVNGFNEAYQGWGYEDSDLVIRLLRAGVRRYDGRFAIPVLHLWHRESDRSLQDKNYNRLMAVKSSDTIWVENGIKQHLRTN